LGIEVDEKNTTAEFGKCCAQANRRCCLSDATLLIKDRDDFGLAMFGDRSGKREILRRSSKE
jgi:hypothetical protein